jgi:hypothetical protein
LQPLVPSQLRRQASGSEIERFDPNKEILTSQTHQRTAAVHISRYNDINTNTIAVFSSLGPGVTWQGQADKAEMDSLHVEFQNKITGSYNGRAENWLYRGVEGQVDEYNSEVHMKDLRIRRAMPLVPNQRNADEERK